MPSQIRNNFSMDLRIAAGPSSGRFNACASAVRPRKGRSCPLPSPARNLYRTMHHSEIKSEVRRLIAEGTVLPAHPLALDAGRKLDKLHQRAPTRYYIDAGAGGLGVGGDPTAV